MELVYLHFTDKNIVKKGLVVAIIFLFVAVSFQPVFAINQKSKDEIINNISDNGKKLEYIIEITKENKVIRYSVFLTEKQANDLDILIDSIHSKLNNSKSNDDTINIFYDSVDSFNGLGVFPDNISINEIKQLVTGENRDLDKIRFKKEMGDGFENRFCFVSSYTTNTFTFGPIILSAFLTIVPLLAYGQFLDFLVENFHITKFKLLTMLLWVPAYILLTPLVCSFLSFYSIEPYSIGSLITYGYHVPNFWYPEYSYDVPSYGWISTHGLNGNKSYNGDFFGIFSIPLIFVTLYTGIAGFTGISIRKPDGYIFRQGFALHVKINSNSGV